MDQTEREALRQRLEASVRGAVRLDANTLTVGQLVTAFLTHGTADYAARRGTTEVQNYRDATRELTLLYGDRMAVDFDIEHLKAVRLLLIENGLARQTINKQRIRRIRGIFAWATEHHGLDGRVLARLRSVKPLRPDVDGAREAKKRLPATFDQVRAVVGDSKCPMVNRDMLASQAMIGSRPGEHCLIRGDEIDNSRSPWTWWPEKHKNLWREKPRVIAIGPKAQLILVRYLRDGYLFQTKRGRPFRVDHYHQMLAESCERTRTPRFSPNQVRKLTAMEADRLYDVETAQEVLSHADVRTTEAYLHRAGRRATKFAQEQG